MLIGSFFLSSENSFKAICLNNREKLFIYNKMDSETETSFENKVQRIRLLLVEFRQILNDPSYYIYEYFEEDCMTAAMTASTGCRRY